MPAFRHNSGTVSAPHRSKECPSVAIDAIPRDLGIGVEPHHWYRRSRKLPRQHPPQVPGRAGAAILANAKCFKGIALCPCRRRRQIKDPDVDDTDRLGWAAKDARDFAAVLKRQQGRLYRKVEVKLLADEDADSASILDGLTWLRRQVGQGDVGVVFLAGHGVTDPGGDYYYVPYNAKLDDVAGVPLPTRDTSVPDTAISRTLKQLAGNALFFFDTCHAGKAAGVSFRGTQDYNKLINEIAGRSG